MQSYQVLARFYEAVLGEMRVHHAAYLRWLILKHAPAARTVLELGCGTGAILKQLERHFEVAGLDLSKDMLAVAAENVPGARLYHEDMTRFDLDERFDVVLCVFDSINHLVAFEQWEAVFDRAREHLNDGGSFVFDINTEHQLAQLQARPNVSWFGDDNLFLLDVSDGGDGVTDWRFRVFENLGAGTYRLHTDGVREASFPLGRIEVALSPRFREVRVYDGLRPHASPESERVHFVCRP